MSTRALRLSPSPASDVMYPKGTIVLCYHCAKPLYRLQASIYVGEPMARSAWKYAPVSLADVIDLMQRSDLEPGQRAAFKAVPLEDWRAHVDKIPEMRPGDFADCAACHKQFVFAQTSSSEDGRFEFADKGYVITLAVIPPQGQARRVVVH